MLLCIVMMADQEDLEQHGAAGNGAGAALTVQPRVWAGWLGRLSPGLPGAAVSSMVPAVRDTLRKG